MIKKVLINIRQLQFRYTGVQSYIYNLCISLVKEFPHIHFDLATLNYQNDNQYIETLRKNSNTTILNTEAGSSSLVDIYFDHFLVSKLVTKQDIYFNPVNITPVFKKPGVKYVVGVLDLCTFIVPKTTTLLLKTYYRLFLPGSLKRADKIIAISKSTKKDIIKIFKTNPKKISVVYLGIDTKILKSNYSINQKKEKYFLTMATSRRKNIQNVLKAFAAFSNMFPSIKFKIVVNNPKLSEEVGVSLKKLNIKNKVELMENYISKEKLSSLYSGALGFVYCPVYEGFGLPVLEAMSKNCPVITSTTSSLPEVAGKSALTVNPHSFQEIAKAMTSIAENLPLRQKMILEGQKNITKFSWKKSAQKVKAEFDKL